MKEPKTSRKPLKRRRKCFQGKGTLEEFMAQDPGGGGVWGEESYMGISKKLGVPYFGAQDT